MEKRELYGPRNNKQQRNGFHTFVWNNSLFYFKAVFYLSFFTLLYWTTIGTPSVDITVTSNLVEENDGTYFYP